MRLSDHDLLQLTEEELPELPEEVLRRLTVKLLYDLKEARERLKQTSRNSSRPPSSDLLSVGWTWRSVLAPYTPPCMKAVRRYCPLKTNGWKRYQAVVCCVWTKRPGGN